MPEYSETFIALHTPKDSKYPDDFLAVTEAMVKDGNRIDQWITGLQTMDPNDYWWDIVLFLCAIPGVQEAILDQIPNGWGYPQRMVENPTKIDFMTGWLLDVMDQVTEELKKTGEL